MKNGGNLIVHAVEKKPKAKRGNKQTKVGKCEGNFLLYNQKLDFCQVVDTATGLVVQGADENYAAEQKYREVGTSD